MFAQFSMNRQGRKFALAFFLLFLLFFAFFEAVYGQNLPEVDFPVIRRLDPGDTNFRQYISDVENSRRLIAAMRRNLGPNRTPSGIAENLTIYRYTPRQGEDIFSLAARTNIPYSALASLNKLSNPLSLEIGKPILLPSIPGLYIPYDTETDLEALLSASRLSSEDAVELRIDGRRFFFFPGADFTPTERAFFLNSGFRFPLRNFRLTSEFGLRTNPVTGNIAMHHGLDLAAPEGTEVFPTADGVVTEIGYDPIYGNYIIITHSERWTSLYGHLQSVETVLRSNVKSSTLIGRVGSTGQSTGPHLHFELRQDGRALDPARRLRQ